MKYGEWQSYPPNPGGMPIKSDRLNMWTVRIRTRELRRAPLGKESLHCKTHLCKSIVKSYRTPALHGLAPFPPHLGPKAPQKRLISKVSKPFGQSLPNPWMSQLRGKISFSLQNIVKWIIQITAKHSRHNCVEWEICKKKWTKHEFEMSINL